MPMNELGYTRYQFTDQTSDIYDICPFPDRSPTLDSMSVDKIVHFCPFELSYDACPMHTTLFCSLMQCP
jgi:hypothetical protein